MAAQCLWKRRYGWDQKQQVHCYMNGLKLNIDYGIHTP